MGDFKISGWLACIALVGCQSPSLDESTAGEGLTSGGEVSQTSGMATSAGSASGTGDGPNSSGNETRSGSDSTGDTTGFDTEGEDSSTGDTGEDDELPPCEFFSSPRGGQDGADGSLEMPWGPLEQLAANNAIPEGTLCLMDGFHGNPVLQGLAPSAPTMIRASNRAGAVVGTLGFVGVEGLSLWGLSVDGSTQIDPASDQRQSFLVTGDAATSNISLEAMLVQSAESSESWTQEGWIYNVRSGVDFRGGDITVRDTTIRNTYHALLLRGNGSVVEGNTIDNFGGDAIRGLGSDSRYSWNLVRDAYIDEYEVQHDDAFQAYRLDGEELRISNVTIDHNQFILFADPITDFVVEHELVGTLMQGVIITDGYADGWVVENNLIVNGQAHGITLFGARNCRVQNNTVVAHPQFVPDAGPWIRITDQTKTGQENFDNVIRNNVAQMLTPWDYDSSSTVESNSEGPAHAFFVDANALDFHPALSSAAIDAGTDVDLSKLDLDGNARRVGAAVDLGAYESSADE